ncbi:hypothetical protein G6F31_020182 [Rhizopus arrhizus]|nr:hypothetical protein G6F31_020182 [Rhizopus arrhizus]
MPSAVGRRRTNHGAISALTAAAPKATQPMPLTTAAAYNCHGAWATAQPAPPSASSTAPPNVGDPPRARQEVQGDGAGDQRHAPAGALHHSMQEHGRSVKADAPAKDGQRECGGEDFPAEKGVGSGHGIWYESGVLSG